jgi:acyl-CoA synthetase (AMP-forming)/AMP-acid ligase II
VFLRAGAHAWTFGHKDDDATRERMRQGWFHTGDLGCMDADGFIGARHAVPLPSEAS